MANKKITENKFLLIDLYQTDYQEDAFFLSFYFYPKYRK